MGPVGSFIEGSRALLGERLVTGLAVREHHSHGEDTHRRALPDAVAFVETTDEVSQIVRLCSRFRIPVVPYGAGTSVEGQVTPLRGGLSLDLSRMNRILSVDQADMDCHVEAGVLRGQLNECLRDQGLFFPVDPGTDCTIGGMCGTRASGTNAVRYGTMRDNVLGLTVVLADGSIMQTGGRARKSSSGYDLTRLMIGSEGTLAVITEARLRLHGIPEAIAGAVAQFQDLAQGVEVVGDIARAGIQVARIELLDEVQTAACIKAGGLSDLQPLTTLLFEFHGTQVAVEDQAQRARAIALEYGATSFAWATDADQRSRLWKARNDAYWSTLALSPGSDVLTTDTVVPISILAETIVGVREDITRSGLIATILGHVGDGNFHTIILIPQEPDARQRAWELDRRIVARALEAGGSCSGEHGIGFGKKEFFLQEHGPEAVRAMRAIKRSLDPDGIFNPGKFFDEDNTDDQAST